MGGEAQHHHLRSDLPDQFPRPARVRIGLLIPFHKIATAAPRNDMGAVIAGVLCRPNLLSKFAEYGEGKGGASLQGVLC